MFNPSWSVCSFYYVLDIFNCYTKIDLFHKTKVAGCQGEHGRRYILYQIVFKGAWCIFWVGDSDCLW